MSSLDEMSKSKPKRAQRRFDPERRTKILEATLDTVAEYGAGETTLRRVADRADVPLGSVSYHFDGRDALLVEAFSIFASEMSSILQRQFEGVVTKEGARAALVEHICGDSWASERNLLLSYEMYAFTSRTALSKAILNDWISGVRAQLEKYFDRRTADALDALIEGYTIHRSVDRQAIQRADVEAIIERVAP